MNEHEITRLAAALHQARPDWPVKQLVTLMSDPRLVDRPRRDVFVALAWVACEASSASPYRVLEAGPWWRAAAADGGISPRSPFDPATHCGVCSEDRARCRLLWSDDHDFEPVLEVRARKGATDIRPVVAELKGHLERTRPAAVLHDHTHPAAPGLHNTEESQHV
jgi:hypothetical protein